VGQRKRCAGFYSYDGLSNEAGIINREDRTMNNETSLAPALAAALLAFAAAAPAAAAPAQEGVVVVRDRVTGQLRTPTAAELRALRAKDRALEAPPALAPSVKRPDGTRHLHLGERGMVYSVLTREPDGSHTMHCVHGANAAGAVMSKEGRHESE
jgi:hypothetical protein